MTAPAPQPPSGNAAPARALSPSLARSGLAHSPGAYEIKFLLTEPLAREVESAFAGVLAADPHADPALGGAYAITSLYCDTARWDVYFREGRHATRKYRVRRYGPAGGGPVFVERKIVVDRRVRKRRTPVDEADLARTIEACSGDAEWFARQVAARALAPSCRVRYLRRAMFGLGPEGPMRVTFDRSVRGSLARGWSFDAGEERPILDGVVVCEFKFEEAMPAAMRAVVARLGLAPTGTSKYRACVGAFARELGLPPPLPADRPNPRHDSPHLASPDPTGVPRAPMA